MTKTSQTMEERFDKKFTRISMGGKDKGMYKRRWFVRETTAEQLLEFIHQELKKQREEIDDCYCVCHSEVSSKPYCKHCERAVLMAIENQRREIRKKNIQQLKDLIQGMNGLKITASDKDNKSYDRGISHCIMFIESELDALSQEKV
jgi:hypothetical protein